MLVSEVRVHVGLMRNRYLTYSRYQSESSQFGESDDFQTDKLKLKTA